MAKSLPNILLIMSDQHRYDAMGCAGHPVVQTPNLDRLAQEGFLLDQVYCQGPVCMPSRFSFLMGRYVHDHGTWLNFSQPSPDSPTFLKQLQAAGYHTAMIGKAHLWVQRRGEHVNDHIDEMKHWGFSEIEEIAGKKANLTIGSPYIDSLKKSKLFRSYYQRASGSMQESEPFWHSEPFPLPEDVYPDYYIGQKSVEWLRAYSGSQPFCLWVGFPGPHDPYDAPQRYADLYNPKDMPVKLFPMPSGNLAPYVLAILKASDSETLTLPALQQLATYYYGNITLIDDWIGGILSVLEERGWAQNTWVIYTSDHGEMLGDHRLLQKLTFYEGAIRVPAIVKPPSQYQTSQGESLVVGQKLKGLFAHFDIPATLLDLLEIQSQAGDEGISFRETLPICSSTYDAKYPTTVGRSQRSAVFSEAAGYTMVVTGGFKYVIQSTTHQPIELYNLDTDPGEMINLAQDNSFARIRQQLEDNHLGPFLQEWDPSRLTEKESIMSLVNRYKKVRRRAAFEKDALANLYFEDLF